ncbi:hypothetical protein HOI71_17895 [Candidatus Poribacteria bacterium]|nr:hypothetical protein [Candidatus Poribacteria bacterium]
MRHRLAATDRRLSVGPDHAYIHGRAVVVVEEGYHVLSLQPGWRTVPSRPDYKRVPVRGDIRCRGHGPSRLGEEGEGVTTLMSCDDRHEGIVRLGYHDAG